MRPTDALKLVENELIDATRKFEDFKSAHEGYAVILEEMDELKAEVWRNNQNKDTLQKEAKQVAAMAIRFMVDLC